MHLSICVTKLRSSRREKEVSSYYLVRVYSYLRSYYLNLLPSSGNIVSVIETKTVALNQFLVLLSLQHDGKALFQCLPTRANCYKNLSCRDIQTSGAGCVTWQNPMNSRIFRLSALSFSTQESYVSGPRITRAFLCNCIQN